MGNAGLSIASLDHARVYHEVHFLSNRYQLITISLNPTSLLSIKLCVKFELSRSFLQIQGAHFRSNVSTSSMTYDLKERNYMISIV